MTIKVGVIGDSQTDAYRGTDNRGGSYAAVSENWLELLVRYRGFDAGAWGAYAEPRRTDYARNWARSAANSEDLLSQGQHTGLAAQLDGATYAIVYIGTNDIRPDDPPQVRYTYSTIYNDASNPATFYANPIASDVLDAVDALLAAGPAGVLLFDYANMNRDPDIADAWPNATNRARVTAVWTSINAQLRAGASSRGIALVEYDAWTAELLSRSAYETGGTYASYTVWNQTITRDLGDEPHHQQLADNHFGTVLNWLLAGLVVETLNRAYGTGIRRLLPFEPWDLVGFAGRPKGTLGRAG